MTSSNYIIALAVFLTAMSWIVMVSYIAIYFISWHLQRKGNQKVSYIVERDETSKLNFTGSTHFQSVA